MVRGCNVIKVVALFLVSGLLLLSCSSGVVDEPAPGEGEPPQASGVEGGVVEDSSVVELPVSTLAGLVEESQGPVYRPVVMERPSVSYLQEVVPPCLPVGESGRDPCQGAPISFSVSAGSSLMIDWVRQGVPTLNEVLLDVPTTAPHIAIRGLVQADSTRCDIYPFEDFSYVIPSITGFHYYYCFADIMVHEYIVGSGPAKLTVAMHREVLFIDHEEAAKGWQEIKDYMPLELEDPQSGTASLYEGKEMVLLLGTASTVALEAWAFSGGWGTLWFLQRKDDGEIGALEQYIYQAQTPEERSPFYLPLSELVQQIKEAAENRATVTGGRIGLDPSLPMLVTDANRLQDFYGAVGAVYEGEDATVLPPPVPGGGEPEQDPTRVGENQPTSTMPAPGDEETDPPPTDDAVTTSTDAASRPQAGDESSTTITTPPVDAGDTTTTTLPLAGGELSTTSTAQVGDTTPTGTTLPPAGSDTTVPAVDSGAARPTAGDASSTTSTAVSSDGGNATTLPEGEDGLPTPTGTTLSTSGGAVGPAVE